MKYFKSILFLAIGVLLSTSVAYSQDTPEDQPALPVEAYAKTLDAKPLAFDVMAIEKTPTIVLEVSNFAITPNKSTALAYVPGLPTYAENTARYRSSIVGYKSATKIGKPITIILKIPLIYC